MNTTQFPRMYQHTMLIPWNKFLSCRVNREWINSHPQSWYTLKPRNQASCLNLKNISNKETTHTQSIAVIWRWKGVGGMCADHCACPSTSTGNSQLTNMLSFDPQDNTERWIGEILLPPLLWARKLGQRMTGSPKEAGAGRKIHTFSSSDHTGSILSLGPLNESSTLVLH